MAGCKVCGAEVRIGACFCWRCGVAFDRAPGMAASSQSHCTVCGHRVSPGTTVCSICEGRLPVTASTDGLVGAVSPTGRQAQHGAEPASARAARSIVAAGAALRPGGSPLFTADQNRRQPSRGEQACGPGPSSSRPMAHVAADAGREGAREQPADLQRTADPRPAGRAPRQPTERTHVADVIQAKGYRASGAYRRHFAHWTGAALIAAAAVTGGWYWQADSGGSLPKSEAESPDASAVAMARERSPLEAETSHPSRPPSVADIDRSRFPHEAERLAALPSIATAPDDPATAAPAPQTPVPAAGSAHSSGLADGRPGKALPARPTPGGSAGKRKSAARNPAAKADAAPRPEAGETVLALDATPEPQLAPAPPAPTIAISACEGLQGLKLQQCLSCGGMAFLRKVLCEQSARTRHCLGEGASTPDCRIDSSNERVGN